MKYFNRIKRLNNRGVTLIETLIVMGLLSTMLVVMASIFTSAADVQSQSQSYSATDENGRFIMMRLNYDIARATSVTTPSSISASTTELDLDISGQTFKYVLSGNDLQLTDSSGTDNLNSNDVSISGLTFSEEGPNITNPIIDYSFTVTSHAKSHGSSDIQTYSGSEELR